jgi:hypothetical protein
MAHKVYANGYEIAAKVADGKSAAAFPDVCFTPPTPPTPGVPVPYANTCYAKDITNGSTSVFIGGKTIALADESYFKSSVGDASATKGLKKGIVSANIDGRAFFVKWSPNVKVEGFGVPRHLDTVTHNHSNPGNTGLFPYLATAEQRKPCEKTEDKINKACKEKPKAGAPAPKKKNRFAFWKKEEKAAYNRDWRSDHCDLLGFSTGKLTQEEAKKFLEQAKAASEQIQQAKEQITQLLKDSKMELLIKGGQQMAESFTANKARALAYTGSGAAAGAGIGVWFGGVGALPGAAIGARVGQTAGTVHSAYDAINAALDTKQLYKALSGQIEKWNTTLGELDPLKKYVKPDGTVDEKGANTFLADLQDAMATANACTRARKCNIIPKSTLVDKDNTPRGLSEKADNHGCCNGQTGHHILSDAMIKDAGCTNYDYAKAPTVCVEGYSQYFGSHQRVHSALSSQLGKKKAAGKVAADNTMSLDDGIDAAVKSHTHAFIASGCDPRCTRAQLEAYYKHIGCPEDARVNMVNEYGQKENTKKGRKK